MPTEILITPDQIADRRLANRPDLPALIAAACAMVATRAARPFLLATATELYDGAAQPRVWLLRTPVAAVTDVSVDGNDVDNSDGLAWTVQPLTGELRLGDGTCDLRFAPRFPRGLQNVSVTYTGGYAQTPDDLTYAVCQLVKHLADSLKVTGLFAGETLGDYRYQLAAAGTLEWPPAAAAIVDSYSR